MERKGRGDEVSRDRDGVRVYDRARGLRLDVVLLLLLVASALGAFFLLRRGDPPPEDAPRSATEARRESAPLPAEASRRLERRPFSVRRRSNESETALDAPPAPEESDHRHVEQLDVPAGDYIAVLRESGETAGLAAFPPPGTNPPRSGVIVPPDYDLPEGFARHHQTTDDGRRLQAVLVVAPGYEIVDDSGEPVGLVDDRIVPPEYAPEDLPVQILEVPQTERAVSGP